jgi:predicted metal-dependent hydrolase
MNYQLIRSKRKTIAIYIKDGGVLVRAPLRTSAKEIDQLVAAKQSWITKHLQKSQQHTKQREAFTVRYGDALPLRGDSYPLVSKDGATAGFENERSNKQFFIPPNPAPHEIKHACIQIYRILAKQHLSQRVQHFSRIMAVTPTAVKVTNAQTRWGSCSAKGSLNFSWRIMMADDEVIDYLVVHELAHLKEMNHSSRFWSVVEGVLPDYKIRQKRLKQLQQTLATQDWR